MALDVGELIRQGEGNALEFKEGFKAEREAIETLCAFASANGGTVLVGVSVSNTPCTN